MCTNTHKRRFPLNTSVLSINITSPLPQRERMHVTTPHQRGVCVTPRDRGQYGHGPRQQGHSRSPHTQSQTQHISVRGNCHSPKVRKAIEERSVQGLEGIIKQVQLPARGIAVRRHRSACACARGMRMRPPPGARVSFAMRAPSLLLLLTRGSKRERGLACVSHAITQHPSDEKTLTQHRVGGASDGLWLSK